MRSNKRRIDARIPVWLYDALMQMAWNRGYNFTEMLQAAAEKGLTWYFKQWEKMHPTKKDASEDTSESCPNSYENNSRWEYNKKYHEFFKDSEELPSQGFYETWKELMQDKAYQDYCRKNELNPNRATSYAKYTDEIINEAFGEPEK